MLFSSGTTSIHFLFLLYEALFPLTHIMVSFISDSSPHSFQVALSNPSTLL